MSHTPPSNPSSPPDPTRRDEANRADARRVAEGYARCLGARSVTVTVSKVVGGREVVLASETWTRGDDDDHQS